MGRTRLIPALLALGCLTLPFPLEAADALPVIKGIRVVRSGDTVGVEISADRNLEYTCYKMPQLQKLVVDLPMTEPGRPDTVYKVESTMISTIKMRKKTVNDVMLTRISVDLKEDADFAAQYDPSDRTRVTFFLRKPATPEPTGVDTASAAPHPPANRAEPSVLPRTAVPAPAATTPRPASISRVTFGPDGIDIVADGGVGDFRAFILTRPQRLVIDMVSAQTALRTLTVPRNSFGIRQARIGMFDGKLRLVLETGEQALPDHEVVRTASGLRVAFRPAGTGKNQTSKGTR